MIDIKKEYKNIANTLGNEEYYELENEKGFIILSHNVRRKTGDAIMKEYGFYDDDIYLEKIYSSKPNRGYGNDLLNFVIEYGKYSNKNIIGIPRVEKRLSQKQLEAWYERKGFSIVRGEFYDFMYIKNN